MNKPDSLLQIGEKKIGQNFPTFFIADIAANHDGDLERAKDLIYMAAEAGADAAKFQHFEANTIVSDYGFKSLGAQKSHQLSWKKSVFEVYEDASLCLDWTEVLEGTCKKAGISFFTSPYAIEIVNKIDSYVPAYKIGSGDITWLEIISYIASKGKPYIIASGASTLDDVVRAVKCGLDINPKICLMQCNTNYTASLENFNYIQLNVLKTYRNMYPDIVLGLSDHTPGHATVIGAITLGARMIEKHFTDDKNRNGPDHKFSMDLNSWREMVDRARELEAALGDGIKEVEDNEKETSILQRRAICAIKDICAGEVIARDHLSMLRPCPREAIPPFLVNELIGKKLRRDVKSGEYITWMNLE